MFGRVGTHLFRHTKSSSHVVPNSRFIIKGSSAGTHHEKFSFTWTGSTPTTPGDGELELTRCRDHRGSIFATKTVIRCGSKSREKGRVVRVSTHIRRIHEVAQQVSFWDPSIVVSHCMQTYVNVVKLWVKWWKSS